MMIRWPWVTQREDFRRVLSRRLTIDSSYRHSKTRRGGLIMRSRIYSRRRIRRQLSGRTGINRYSEITRRSSLTSRMLTAHINSKLAKMKN